MQVFGDFFTLQRGNTYKSALLGFPGPVLLGLGSIERNGGFRGGNLKTYGGDTDPRMLLGPGDVYVSLKDVTQSADLLGAVARVPVEVKRGRVTQDTVKLEFIDGAPIDYLYWLMRTPDYRQFCRAHATGTTNLGLPRDDFLSYPVPELTYERLALVGLLEDLEAKIELNRRMNETLEAMAQAIFRDWFVDFGPTRRTMEGTTDPVAILGGLIPSPEQAAHIASLFPATIGDDGLPEGWEPTRIDEVMKLAYGKSLTKKDRTEGDFPVYGSGGVNGTHNAALVKGPGIIVGRKGTVGSLYWEERDFYPIDTVFYVKPSVPLSFAYYLLQTLGLENMNTDAAVPGLNRNNVYRLDPPVGCEATRNAFEGIVDVLRGKIAQGIEENQTLAATRDLLLPKLMSGEVRLKDVEQLG